MSLLDDALKRQEELNRAGGKTAEGQAPRVTPSVPPPAEKPKAPRPPVAPPPKNPFLEREKSLPRPATNFYMPLVALLVLLALLFLRREFAGRETPQEELVAIPPIELEGPLLAELTNIVEGVGEIAVTNVVPAVVTEAVENEVTTNAPSSVLSAEASATNAVEVVPPEPTNLVARVESSGPQWPLFTLTGIAVGRERLAILDTGEMLVSGEVARCGAKVVNVSTSSVTFAWQGETKTLRKGERSDKMLQLE